MKGRFAVVVERKGRFWTVTVEAFVTRGTQPFTWAIFKDEHEAETGAALAARTIVALGSGDEVNVLKGERGKRAVLLYVYRGQDDVLVEEPGEARKNPRARR